MIEGKFAAKWERMGKMAKKSGFPAGRGEMKLKNMKIVIWHTLSLSRVTIVFSKTFSSNRQHFGGQTLAQLLAQPTPLCRKRSKNIFVQCAVGLWYLHRTGIIHGGMHPGNVVIANNKNKNNEETILLIKGDQDVRYEAAEHGRKESDIFALGCTLHVMMHGKHPFGRDRESIAGNIRCGSAKELEIEGSSFILVNQMLDHQPSRRIKAEEVVDHYFCWTRSRAQAFLTSANSVCGKIAPGSDLEAEMNACHSLVIGCGDWRRKVSNNKQTTMTTTLDSFNRNNTVGLLNAVVTSVNADKTEDKDCALEFWTDSFPFLLPFVFGVLERVKNENPSLRPFYTAKGMKSEALSVPKVILGTDFCVAKSNLKTRPKTFSRRRPKLRIAF